jgi:hypothetical protein
MLWVRRMDRTQKGATPAMNAYAILVVNDHLETLRAEAAARRSFRVERPSLFQRIAASVASLKASISTPVETASTAL